MMEMLNCKIPLPTPASADNNQVPTVVTCSEYCKTVS